MRYLMVVDLQKEFVKDRAGQKVYDKALRYIEAARDQYNAVLAAVYKNVRTENRNMDRLVQWDGCMDIQDLEFIPDQIWYHSGYSIKEYPYVTSHDVIDVIGFDTDACVLSCAFHIFDLGCDMRIIEDLCWSSGGRGMHEHGIAIMKRQFGKALTSL